MTTTKGSIPQSARSKTSIPLARASEERDSAHALSSSFWRLSALVVMLAGCGKKEPPLEVMPIDKVKQAAQAADEKEKQLTPGRTPGSRGQAGSEAQKTGEVTKLGETGRIAEIPGKATSAVKPKSIEETLDEQEKGFKKYDDYGASPPVPKDANDQVKSIVQALQTRENPERLSTLMRPAPFDVAAYKANPKEYLNKIEPGRVFAPAEPGPNVPQIASMSSQYQEVVQGESVTLLVKSAPGAPVTFTSFDLGAFENKLTSITVQADGNGTAQAKFFGTPGTISDVNILAASPLTSGQVKFVVNVSKPAGAADVKAD